MRDLLHTAQTDETRARRPGGEDRLAEVERLMRGASELFESGAERSPLAEALIQQGTAMARAGHRDQARVTLERAFETAQSAGDRESAGRASLTLIEELGDELLDDELLAAYGRADALLRETRCIETQRRMIKCVRIILFLMGKSPGPPNWERFSLDRVLHRYEAAGIDRALRDAGGVIARAAQLLGLKRQSLSHMLHTRHKGLTARHPRVASSSVAKRAPAAKRREVSVLCVEDSSAVADAIRDSLEAEGWRVLIRTDYDTARAALEGAERFDLLMFDYMLPGGNGVSLTQLARGLTHRRRTPILMLTASEVEDEARRAGVNAYLRKPQEITDLFETASRLLGEDRTEPGKD